ncbi:hypothetical protein P4O66_019327 [Electrophorus voltai]|uniref:Uncharacterized protein n=1 Tax=Electrophorus voltai TaxID=2609070 RepID=A0AAD8ZT69_9TELE|nr:hypothetical protein P4O66_019327 [Electrophorus voltai]
MSGARGSFKMSSAELKQQQAIQRSCALSRTYLLSSSMIPLPSGPSIGEGLKFPSLPTYHWTSMVPLSITEASIFTPGQQVLFQEFSQNRPSPWKHNSSLPLCKSFKNTEEPSETQHTIYTHFSHPLRPIPKKGQPIAPTQRLTIGQCDGLQPLVKRHCQLPHEDTLSVRGTHCLPSRPLSITATPAARIQLHVFLPVEGTEEEEDGDSKSADDDFMDDTDNKATKLWHQQRERKTPQPQQ